jgi:glucose/arabinose dehydrogenase/plastocyanin/lysophospholipase L1-like esterase
MSPLFARSFFPATAIVLSAQVARAQIEFQQDAHVLFYGNALVERLLEHGDLEARVQIATRGKNVHFRSLAWTGDEVANRLRAEGYAAHMKELLAEWPANVVVLGYGGNESFAGPAGLPAFRSALAGYLDQLARLHPGAKFVILSPIATEGDAARSAVVKLYADALADAAKQRGAVFVDLFTASEAAYAKSKEPLTTNGIHLNDTGNREMALVIAKALVGKAAETANAAHVKEVAAAASQLAYYTAEIVRPKNGILYYGQRKRPNERAAELPLYLERIKKADAVVQKVASSESVKFADQPFIALAPLPPVTKGGSNSGVGTVKSAAEMQAELKVAPGYSLNLFASEEQFPELRAPVQIAFDARGRLWVVTMPSFPHTVPGQPQEDKIIVLEDTDRDGKADKCTTFAGGFDALDGIAFTENGALIGEQSRHWLMRDTDGDGRADTKTEALRGLDVTDSHHGGMVATDPTGGVWFSDGVFHRSQFETPFGVHRGFDSSTYRLNPRTGRIETEWQSITPNPWRVTFDRTGNAFQMYGDGLVLDGLALTWTPLGVYHPFSHTKVVGYGKGSAAASISSPNFPDEYQLGMASAALLGPYAVSLTKFDFANGLAKGSGRLDVVTSQNPAFRPVDVNFGFDGALYVSDFSSAIIGHAQNPMRDARWNHTKGRIWRVVYDAKPVVKNWPVIEGRAAAELCALLTHPQDIVRHHARIELRKLGKPALAAVDSWVAGKKEDDQAVLEALFVAEGLGETRPALLGALLKSQSPMHRAAAVHLVRLQAARLPDFATLLQSVTADPHPRVRMQVVDAIAHLRPAFPAVESLVHAMHGEQNGSVKTMLADLGAGTAPRLASSVPVLEIPKDALLAKWNDLGDGVYQTFIRSDAAQPAVLAVKYSFLDVSLNGVQVLSFDSQWSSEQQARLELQPGLNTLEIKFRRLRGNPPAVHLFSPVGEKLPGAQLPSDDAQLAAFTAELEKLNATLGKALRVQAVPNQMIFAPRELRVKAGAKVRLIFDNPDLMLHNFVLVARGAEEEIGALADKLAADPNGMAKQYVPTSPKILFSTPLVEPNKKAELTFDAPKEPGEYPYLCTFPSHWRVMQGVLIVEGASQVETRKYAAADGFESSIPKTRIAIAKTEDHAGNTGGGKDTSALFNGTTRNGNGTAETRDDGKTFRGYGTGDTLTITLNTARAHGGFDIAEIRTFAGHSDARASQAFTVLAASAHEPTKFKKVETVKLVTTGGATEVRIPASENLRSIVALRFEFNDGPLGYNLYREIAITGSERKGH